MGSWSGIGGRQGVRNRRLYALAEMLMLVEQYHEGSLWQHASQRSQRMTLQRFSDQQIRDVRRLEHWLQNSRPAPRRAWSRYHRYRGELARMLSCPEDAIDTTPLSVRVEAQERD